MTDRRPFPPVIQDECESDNHDACPYTHERCACPHHVEEWRELYPEEDYRRQRAAAAETLTEDEWRHIDMAAQGLCGSLAQWPILRSAIQKLARPA